MQVIKSYLYRTGMAINHNSNIWWILIIFDTNTLCVANSEMHITCYLTHKHTLVINMGFK